MIFHYLKIAFRNLLRHKVQSVISIVGLAVGFTAFILGGYWYYWEHTFDTFHPDWKNTYALTTTGVFKTADGKDGELNQIHEDVKNHFATFPEIEQMCTTSLVSYRSEGKEKSWIGLRTDSTFFSMFRADFLEGTNKKEKAYNGQSVVLTKKMAQYLFGDSLCTDKIFKANERTSFLIAGVIDNYPQNTDFKFDYIVLGEPTNNSRWRSTVYVHVNPRADINALKNKIETYRLDKEDTEFDKPSQWRFHLCAMPDVHLRCSQGLSARFRNINILAFAGLLAFVSALMNLLVLFIGQQQRKLRINFTFRVMGASMRGMVGKKLIELSLPLVLAFVLALALIEIIFPSYQMYTRIDNPGYYDGIYQHLERGDIFVAATIIAAVSAIVFLAVGLFPIVAMLRRRGAHISNIFRNGLIAGQIFIGSLFFITSLSMYAQFRFMSRKDKGIETENIWQINLGFQAIYTKDCRPYKDALRNSPYIEDATGMLLPVLSAQGGDYYCSYIANLEIEGRDTGEFHRDYIVAVETNFPAFFGIKMKDGEWIANQGTYDYVVNETGARLLGGENVVGKRINSSSTEENVPPSSICGIMTDYHYCPMQFPIDKIFFAILREDENTRRHLSQQYYYIKVLPQNTEKALEFARTLYKDYEKGEVDPDKQFIYLPQLMDEFNRQEKTMSSIFSLLALICILISSFGIYSLVSLSAEQRKKEIAIRKVNGAVFKDILRLFLKEYVWLLIAGNALALSLGYVFIQHWLETYAYRVDINSWFYIAVFALTGVLVVLSVAIQVRKAAGQNPAEIIKTE